MIIDLQMQARLRTLALREFGEDALPQFMQRLDSLAAFICYHSRERKAPAGTEKKAILADIAALERVIQLVASSDDPDRRMITNLRMRRDMIKMQIDNAKDRGILPRAKADAMSEILAALVEAKGCALADLSRGATPDHVEPTKQLAIVIAAMQAIGINEASMTTWKRMGEALAGPKADREWEEQLVI